MELVVFSSCLINHQKAYPCLGKFGLRKQMDNISTATSEVPSDLIVKQNIYYGKPIEAAIGIFREYCNNSTVHGMRYFGERRRPISERIFWICVFVISIIICGDFITKVWDKWHATPVIVAFDDGTIPVTEIPFPSVLVCPENRVHKKVFNFTQVLYDLQVEKISFNNLTRIEQNYLQAHLHLCDRQISKRFNLSTNSFPGHISDIIQLMAPLANVSVPTYRFNNEVWLNDDIFETVVTDDGLCFQFNGLVGSDLLRSLGNATEQNYEEIDPDEYIPLLWNLEEGYKIPSDYKHHPEYYPERSISAGSRGSFHLHLMGYDYDIDFLCREAAPGFRVYLLSPDDAPQGPKDFIKVSFNEDVRIKLRPNYIKTSKQVQKYPPERRGCFFYKERYLSFFKYYSQSNCNYECLINHTLGTCGCVTFSMPKPPDIRECGFPDIDCYSKAERDLVHKEFELALERLQKNEDIRTECNCLPACASMEYDYEISTADFDMIKMLESFKDVFLDENPGLLASRIIIEYDSKYFTAIKRSELYGTTDFLANCGGILGLFMGVSFLSIIELLYFCTIRLFTNILARRKRQKEVSSLNGKYETRNKLAKD